MNTNRLRWSESWMRRHADGICLIVEHRGRWVAVRGGKVLAQGQATDIDSAQEAAHKAMPYDHACWEFRTHAVAGPGVLLTVSESTKLRFAWSVEVWGRVTSSGVADTIGKAQRAARKALQGGAP